MEEIAEQNVEPLILVIRGSRVILDADLARLYGVSTAALNQAVRRKGDRFPVDFAFRLTDQEKTEVITNCDHLRKLKYSRTLPLAFAEHGAIMAASVLNSRRAVRISVLVVRAFVRMRDLLTQSRELAAEIREIKLRLEDHDDSIDAISDALHRLMRPDQQPRRRIGFGTEEESE